MELSSMSLETARSILISRMQCLTDALSQCQNIWNTKYAFAQMTLDESARAHNINQHWYAFAREIFEGDDGVKFHKDQLQRYLVIDEKVIIRFKLFDKHLLARNYPTDHANDWKFQYPLRGIPQVARLNYGYRMDITGTEVKDAFITLPLGNHNEWVWQTSGEPIDTFLGYQFPLPEPNKLKSIVYYNYHLE